MHNFRANVVACTRPARLLWRFQPTKDQTVLGDFVQSAIRCRLVPSLRRILFFFALTQHFFGFKAAIARMLRHRIANASCFHNLAHRNDVNDSMHVETTAPTRPAPLKVIMIVHLQPGKWHNWPSQALL